MTKISGAPELSKPQLITGIDPQGISNALIGQGFGLAAPSFYDWDGDGLKDLLIGEFGSGVEFGRLMGNFIRVHLNRGTETEPSFNRLFYYANPPFEIPINGTPYSVDQFCCMGFTPQFIDLNNDGRMDMISGQYYGEVISFNGSSKGFLPGKPLPQEGNPRDSVRRNFIRNQPYWLYSSASFGDFTGGEKPDLIVGGRALRLSKNVGALSEPQFTHRELLLDTDGHPLKVYEYTPNELATFTNRYGKSPHNKVPDFNAPFTSGDFELSPLVVDWDGDGVLDLLVTNSYRHKGLAVVDFFRGIKVGAEHRFKPRIPLFTVENSGKEFPGSHPFIFVTDWNHDGINDLLIGVSVVTLHNKFNCSFAWSWEDEVGIMGTGKDPAFFKEYYPDRDFQWLVKDVVLPHGVTEDDFVTMRRQGYLYLMLGSKVFPHEEPKKEKRSNTKSKK
jgi:hypothetical protein